MYRVRQQIGYDESFYSLDNPQALSVAVLDSGIAPHPDFGNRIVAFYDFNEARGNKPYDYMGHGTHVCGCILGDGKLSAGRYKGICPGANLVMGKILDSNGGGTGGQMISGLEWILENKELYKIKVLNISLGVEKKMNRGDLSKICGIIRELIFHNIVVVCAAGNYGPSDDSIYGIGAMPEVITVGCYDGIFARSGGVCCEKYSGRGVKGGRVVKPHLSAKEIKEIVLKGTVDVGLPKNMQGYGMTSCNRIRDLVLNT